MNRNITENIALICFITLFIKGVFGDEVKSVSLYVGDSVTLYTNLTYILSNGLIEWRIGNHQDLLARINGFDNIAIHDNVLDGRFRERLKLDNHTGDLTITDITTQHTGNYKLHISEKSITRKTFNVYVFGVIVKTDMKGDSFILHNNVTKNPGDEKIVWRIQRNNSPVAEIIRNGKKINDTVHDGRFRGRLQVDDQTGDLTITNITTEDSGSYEVDITVGNNSYTIHRSFSVPDKDPQKDHHGGNKDQGQSSGSRSLTTGAIFGIVVGVLAVPAVAVGLIIYLKHYKTTSVL